MDSISAPKQMLVYEGAVHGVIGSPAVTNGPKYESGGGPGRVCESTFEEARKALSIDLA
jgi:hypothetical protein